MTLESSSGAYDFSWVRREAIIERFETAWRADGDADVAQFLPPAGTPRRRDLLLQLARVDMEFRWEKGQRTLTEEYLVRFPELAEPAGPPLELILTEIEVRRHLGCAPPADELTARFPGRAAGLSAAAEAPTGLSASLLGLNPIDTLVGHLSVPAEDATELLDQQMAPGQLLERYELREVLGQGSFAVVYRAFDPTLQRDVAIKRPHAHILEVPGFRERLLREARSAARLRHPAIVPICEVGEADGRPFLVYEFLPGPTLAELLRDTSPSPEQASEWVARLAEALDYAHGEGIIHRDVKPANIMMDGAGRPTLADFGLALQTDALAALTQEGDVLGTPAYMAPEQAAGHKREVGPRSDVYSLGALFYELLCGQPPFQGSVASILHHVIHDEPLRPRQHRPGIPFDLETICLKAMAKEPQRRYDSAGALARDLQRYLQHRPILARRTGPVGRLMRWCRRQPAVAASILIAATICGGFALASFWRVVNERDHARLLAATYALEHGITLCESGEPAFGLLWLARSLELAPPDAEKLCFAIRANLAAWRAAVPRHQPIIEDASPMTRFAASVDGRIAVTQTNDGTATLWHLATSRPVGRRLAGANLEALSLSPSGRLLFTTGGGARLWRVERPNLDSVSPAANSFTLLHHGPTVSVNQAAFSKDEHFVVAALGDATVRVWETTTGNEVGEPMLHPATVNAVKFSPDGRIIVSGSGDGFVRLWDAATHQPIGAPLEHNSRVRAVAAWTDDRFIIAGGTADNKVHLWDGRTGKLLFPPFDLFGDAMNVEFSPDGQIVACNSLGRVVRLWQVATGHALAPLRHRVAVQGVAFTGRRSLFTACEDGTIHSWTYSGDADPALVLRHERQVLAAAFSPDGMSILTGSGLRGEVEPGYAQTWDAQTGQALFKPLVHETAVGSVAISPDGHTFFTSDYAGVRRLWNSSTREMLCPPFRTKHSVATAAFSPDGQTLVTGDFVNNFAARSNVASGQLIATLSHDAPVRSAVFSRDGRMIVTGSYDRTVRLWDAVTHRQLGEPLRNEGSVGAVAINPDGTLLVSGNDASLAQLWDVRTGQPVGAPLRHRGTVRSVAFSPDGRLVATGSWDKTARLWEPTTGLAVGPPLRHDGEVEVAIFSPDGRRLLTGSWDKTAKLWDVPTPMAGSIEDITTWAQALTGMELDSHDAIRLLDTDTWNERVARVRINGY